MIINWLSAHGYVGLVGTVAVQGRGRELQGRPSSLNVPVSADFAVETDVSTRCRGLDTV